MTLFFRTDIGFGRAAVFLWKVVTQIGVWANRTIIKIACISKNLIRNGMMLIVVGPPIWNLCVKSMLEINQQDFFVIHFQCCATCGWIKITLSYIQFQTFSINFVGMYLKLGPALSGCMRTQIIFTVIKCWIKIFIQFSNRGYFCLFLVWYWM